MPRIRVETTDLFGHDEAEAAILDAYRSGRVPHAWLIGGLAGIGKATLAYRFARFALAHPDPAARRCRTATSLAVGPDHPIARRVAAQGHPDLLVLERTIGDTGKLRSRHHRRSGAENRSVFRFDRGRWRLAHCHCRCGRRTQRRRRERAC